MELKDIILRLALPIQAGPLPSFTEPHILLAILTLGKEELGRKGLAKNLGLGEGVVRTLIDRLKKEGLIQIDRKGCKLSKKGKEVFTKITKIIPNMVEINAGKLSSGKEDFALVVNNASKYLKLGIEERDAAVRLGAKGATTIIFKKGRFSIPGGSKDCARDYPDEIWDRLKVCFSLSDGDVIIISSGDDKFKAMYGALAAAWNVISKMPN
jgi:predicted transcriptional regulator